MRHPLLITILLLAGCVQAPPKPEPQRVVVKPPEKKVDRRCEQLSRYARAVANLREVGVTRDDISSFSSQPTVMTFPLQYVQYDVFAHKELTPAQIEQRYDDMCETFGYENVLGQLKKLERQRQQAEQDRLAAEEAEARSKAHPPPPPPQPKKGKK